jgi:hypothetical protein
MKTIEAIAGWSRRRGLDPVIVGITGFFVLHMLIRLFGTTNFTVDDTESAVHIQVLEPYYSLRNPPLFDWLFYFLTQVFGLSVFTIQLLKTVLLTGAGIFLYYAAKPFFRHRIALYAALVAYGATAFYGWDIFQQFSHTVPMIFAMGFTLWAMTRVIRFARSIDYALLGVGLGLGLLSKYLFLLFFAALVLAALARPSYRRAILSWRMIFTLLAAAIVFSPLAVGLLDVAGATADTLSNRVAGAKSWPTVSSALHLFALTMEFWLPFVAILWACLWRWPAVAEAEAGGAPSAGEDLAEDFYPFLRDATIIMVSVMLLAFVLMGTRITGGRYLVSVLSLLPLMALARLDGLKSFPALAVDRFWQAAMIVIGVVAVFRFLTFLFVSPPFCIPRCVVFIDYRPVVERLGTPDGKQNVILSNHVHIGSNLLRLVPNAKVVMEYYTGSSDLGIAPPASRNCYFVWFQKYRNAEEQTLETAFRDALRRPPLPEELAALGPVESVKVDWQTKILPDWGPDTIVGIAKIESAQRICDGGRIEGRSPPPSRNSKQ